MPPHLHPRSTATSTLFAGTLLASFVVVAIPHLVPCPHPRGHGHLNTEIQLDQNGKPIRRARRPNNNNNTIPRPPEEGTEAQLQVAATRPQQPPKTTHTSSQSLQDEAAIFKQLQLEAQAIKADGKDRECPVPKPGGRLGKWLGFETGRKVEVVKD